MRNNNVIVIITAGLFFLASGVISKEVLFRGDRYLRYNPSVLSRNRNNINRVELEFRTIHPTGVLVFMIGRQGDYLSLQLVQGKLRYELAHRFKIFSTVLFGNNLNDNQWHRLKILRTGRINEIKLDSKAQTVLVPKQYEKISVSKLFFLGGLDKALESEMHRKHDIFTGCLRITEMDRRDPISYLMEKHPRVKVVPNGPMSTDCNNEKPTAVEFTKPSSMMVITNIHRRSYQTMSLSFTMRTFHANGVLLSSDNKRCQLLLGIAKAKMFMEIRSSITNSALAKIESQQTIADGLWHKVSIAVTMTDIFLLVDSGSRLSSSLPKMEDIDMCSHPSELSFGGLTTSVSGGFVGCLNNIKLNNIYLNVTPNQPNIEFRNGVRQGCRLQDKCFPNPCRNNGVCSQNWRGLSCDCSKTPFYGEHCEISIYKQSCAEYQRIGLEKPSYCLVDADGSGDLPPFTTLCKFDEDGMAFTTVHHNKEMEFSATDGEEKLQSYVFHRIKYEMSMSQIESLIKNSKSCRQFVRFRCYNAMLLNAPSGPANVVWRSRDGEVKSHWGGVTVDGEGCSCGVNESCIRKDRLCNCDFRNNKWSSDAGYLTDKRFLPVTRLDVTDIHDGFAYFDIGPLECFGTSDEDIRSDPAPEDLLSHVCMSLDESEELVSDANGSKSAIIRTEYNPTTLPTTPPSNQLVDLTTPAINGSLLMTQDPTIRESIKNREIQLSILEICLIAVAAAAVVILSIKFVFCKIYRNLTGQFRFNHDTRRRSWCSERNALAPAAIMNGNDPEKTMLPMEEKKKKKGISAYWV